MLGIVITNWVAIYSAEIEEMLYPDEWHTEKSLKGI